MLLLLQLSWTVPEMCTGKAERADVLLSVRGFADISASVALK